MRFSRGALMVMIAGGLAGGHPGCNRTDGGPSAAPLEEQAASTPRTGSFVFETVDGNAMPYTVSGHGEPTVVLVHCWMCDHSVWDAQVPVLEPRFTVVTLDLPGHGKAGATRAAWTVEAYGHDVAGLLEQLNLRDAILVGHSMGGPVALKAAALARGRVRAIVAVDSLHDAELKFEGPRMESVLAAFEADFAGTCAGMVQGMFVEQGADEVAARVRTLSCESSNPAVGRALFRDFGRIDFPAWFREAGVPIRAINAAKPNETRVESNRQYADFDAVLMEDVGHYLHMTRPQEFNAKLLAVLDALIS